MKCTFSLIRYCHDPRRGEFVNFGLLFHTLEPAMIYSKFSSERIQRIKRLYPDVDENLIKTIKRGIEASLRPLKVQEEAAVYAPLLDRSLAPDKSGDKSKIRLLDPGYLDYLSRYHNGLIQFSSPQPVVTENVHKEFERIYNLYVADLDELVPTYKKELPNTIYQRLRTQLKPVEKRLDLDYELKRDSIQGLIKGTTVDFIGYNGQIVCGKSIDVQNQGIETSAQTITILIQLFDVLRLNFEKSGRRGKYYIVTKAPEPNQKKLYHFWMNVLYWSQKDYFQITDVDGAYQIAQYVEKQRVIPFSEWLKEKHK